MSQYPALQDNSANMRLGYGSLKSGYRVNRNFVKVIDYFAEEQGTRYCGDGCDGDQYYIYGLVCSGSKCDNIFLSF